MLDSYDTERRPIAEANLTRSAEENGFERTAAQGLAIDLRGRLPHAWLPTTEGHLSTLDLLGPGLTLLTDHNGPDWQAAADTVRTPVPLTSHTLDAATAAAIGIEPGAALLVRPDAHVAASWTGDHTDPLTTLRTGIQHATGSPRADQHRVVS